MGNEVKKQLEKDGIVRGFVVSQVRSANNLSNTQPWLPADASALRLKDDEILSHINVVLSVSKRPDDIGPLGWPDELSLIVGMLVDKQKLEHGPESPLRQIKTFAPLPNKNALARILLYCWYTCL